MEFIEDHHLPWFSKKRKKLILALLLLILRNSLGRLPNSIFLKFNKGFLCASTPKLTERCCRQLMLRYTHILSNRDPNVCPFIFFRFSSHRAYFSVFLRTPISCLWLHSIKFVRNEIATIFYNSQLYSPFLSLQRMLRQ